MTATATVQSLHVYPLKSARGLTLEETRLTSTGFDADRGWLLVTPGGRFITQRETPRLALLNVAPLADGLTLWATDLPRLEVRIGANASRIGVRIWDDACSAFDAGELVATTLSRWLQRDCRLVRFDPDMARASNRSWTGDVVALNMFSDGYPILVIGAASLADLNARLPRPLPMERFRPNLVVAGLESYAEDRVHEFVAESGARLRVVKPCTRCVITCTDQQSGTVDGEEPLRTLRDYRWNRELRGVCFGQNAVIAAGIGTPLRAGESLKVVWR